MTTNLEDTIRDLAKRGEISHISLTPSQGGRKWRGSFAMCSKFGVNFAEDEDPVKALMLALTTAKMKPRRVEKGSMIIEQEAVPSGTDADIEALM